MAQTDIKLASALGTNISGSCSFFGPFTNKLHLGLSGNRTEEGTLKTHAVLCNIGMGQSRHSQDAFYFK